jgi:hypothetical protein
VAGTDAALVGAGEAGADKVEGLALSIDELEAAFNVLELLRLLFFFGSLAMVTVPHGHTLFYTASQIEISHRLAPFRTYSRLYIPLAKNLAFQLYQGSLYCRENMDSPSTKKIIYNAFLSDLPRREHCRSNYLLVAGYLNKVWHDSVTHVLYTQRRVSVTHALYTKTRLCHP